MRPQGESIRRFILDHVEKHPANINKVTATHFAITRQAVNKHLQRLVTEKSLSEAGKTRSRTYKLAPISSFHRSYRVNPELAEDVIWRNDVAPALGQLPDNVQSIWHYGFTEMFNNAIDHAGAARIIVTITKTAATSTVAVLDDGVGIFKKIQSELHLLDERHAVLELAKGKLTTDPKRHTGEGIFFSSRMFDSFRILSGGTSFSHSFADPKDWILENKRFATGTYVHMQLSNHTARTTKKIFDQYSSPEDYGFIKTVVPVRLAQYGDDNLVSRSQAKRLLARVELFKIVMFDFSKVPTIGQAFADEIFRVFANKHPDIELQTMHESSEVKRMVARARSGSAG